jgi:hypothetical protein
MGVVRLHRDRVHGDDLPPLCLRCGEPATVLRGKTFSKSQGWTFILIFLGGLPYLLACLVFRDRFHVRAPMCDAHRNHFHWQRAILWGGLLGLIALAAGCLALIGHVPDEVQKNCFIGLAIAAGIWVVVYLGNMFTSITAATVSDEEALLVGVSDEFAKAYERRPDADREMARRWGRSA